MKDETGKDSAPEYPEIETTCEVRQSWVITSPEIPGAHHQIESRIVGLPSDRARYYAADMAWKVAQLEDWGGGGP